MIVRGAGEAFDISKEDAAHDRALRHERLPRRQKALPALVLGKQMLMARRLVEAGCGFVTVQNSGWDMHADGNNPGIGPGMEMLGPPLDKAVGASRRRTQTAAYSTKRCSSSRAISAARRRSTPAAAAIITLAYRRWPFRRRLGPARSSANRPARTTLPPASRSRSPIFTRRSSTPSSTSAKCASTPPSPATSPASPSPADRMSCSSDRRSRPRPRPRGRRPRSHAPRGNARRDALASRPSAARLKLD